MTGKHKLYVLMILMATLPYLVYVPLTLANNELFLGQLDHVRYMAQANFVNQNYLHPWAATGTNSLGYPHLGSTPLNVAVGWTSHFSGIPTYVLFAIVQMGSNLFLFIMIFYFYKRISASRAVPMTLLFMFGTGIGGYVRWLFDKSSATLAQLFTPYTPYYAMPAALGLWSFSLLDEKPHYSTLLSAISILIHPPMGLLFLVLNLLYLLLSKKYLPLIVNSTASVMASSWIFLSRQYQNLSYALPDDITVLSNIKHAIILLLNITPLILFAGIDLVTRVIRKNKVHLDYLSTWFFFLLVFAFTEETYFTVFKDVYFFMLLTIPLAYYAMHGITSLSKKISITPQLIVGLIIILCLPSTHYAYFGRPLNIAETADIEVLHVLKVEQPGIVFGPFEIVNFVPVLSDKQIFYGVNPPDFSSIDDYYNILAREGSVDIISTQNISYILTRSEHSLESYTLIYENEKWNLYAVDT